MRTRSALTAVLVGATALTGVITSAVPSQAAKGVVGRVDSASVRDAGLSCFPDAGIEARNACLRSASTVTVKGWALNKSTAPVQDVRLVVSGKQDVRYLDHLGSYHHERPTVKEVSGAHRANKARNDVKKAYHLSSNAVGYSFSYQTQGRGKYVGATSVCVQARDHGTTQSWRTIQCRTVTGK